MELSSDDGSCQVLKVHISTGMVGYCSLPLCHPREELENTTRLRADVRYAAFPFAAQVLGVDERWLKTVDISIQQAMSESHTGVIIVAVLVPFAAMAIIVWCCCRGHKHNSSRKQQQDRRKSRARRRQRAVAVSTTSCSADAHGRPRNWGWFGQNSSGRSPYSTSYGPDRDYNYYGWVHEATTPAPGRVYQVYPDGWVDPEGYQRL